MSDTPKPTTAEDMKRWMEIMERAYQETTQITVRSIADQTEVGMRLSQHYCDQVFAAWERANKQLNDVGKS